MHDVEFGFAKPDMSDLVFDVDANRCAEVFSVNFFESAASFRGVRKYRSVEKGC